MSSSRQGGTKLLYRVGRGKIKEDTFIWSASLICEKETHSNRARLAYGKRETRSNKECLPFIFSTPCFGILTTACQAAVRIMKHDMENKLLEIFEAFGLPWV
jgi:hypothetical protein